MAFNEYYVDYAAGNDTTGDGSIGTPWKTVQKALTSGALGANGTRVNVQAGSTQVLGATLSTAIAAAQNTALIIQGYTAAANDGGVATIDGAATYSVWNDTDTYIRFADLIIQNAGARLLFKIGNSCSCYNVTFTNTSGTGHGVEMGAYAQVVNSSFACAGHDYNLYLSGTSSHAHGCFFSGDMSTGHLFIAGSDDDSESAVCNIIYSTGGHGIVYSAGHSLHVLQNTILAVTPDASRHGIYSDNGRRVIITNNIVEGFSDASNIGIYTSNNDRCNLVCASNYSFNNTTHYSLKDFHVTRDNEEGVATSLAKTGAATFANRFAYFAPKDVGNVLSPTFGQFKGAVAPRASSYGLTAEILKDDEVVDDVTGTLAAGGGGGTASGFPRRMMKLG